MSLNICMFDIMSMNWVQRKIYLYNVTFGLYMLDAWERYLFSILFKFQPLNLLFCVVVILM
ncbi:putative small subunit of serine palmitoyltransferase [Helianthus annuus]|nr:putative small subunit of serine palmitoyltransferase [Helianthus annuus]